MISEQLIAKATAYLLDERNSGPPSSIELRGDCRGVYSVIAREVDAMPRPLRIFLAERQQRVLYIGSGKQVIKRLWDELIAESPATFFRSIGAVLGYRPAYIPSASRSVIRNYAFYPDDTERIAKWLEANVLVNVLPYDEPGYTCFETKLINRLRPALNIKENPEKWAYLKRVRKECRECVANDSHRINEPPNLIRSEASLPKR